MKSEFGELDERKKKILRAIVNAHIRVGGPVGSKYLAQNQHITLSSATIRNEMAELEALGFLEQPHTSAGRIPSERGYRFYVNSLMEKYRLTAAEMRQLNNLMRMKIEELDKMLEKASKLVSSLTNYTSMSMKPRLQEVVITHIRLLYLDTQTFLLVLVTSADVVKTKYVRSPIVVTDQMLRSMEIELNAYLTGLPLEKITLPVIMELSSRLPEYDQLVTIIIRHIYNAVGEIDSGDLHVEGINLLLQYPEFSDVERFKELLGLLERKEDILNLVSQHDGDSTQVIIGAESRVEVMYNSSFIFRKIKRGGRVVGAIGVLGPCRMDYSRVIATVEHLANCIAKRAADTTPELVAEPGEQAKTDAPDD
ncbi:MAG: heat-inducible transcription repressor HrcA [Clostridiales bacterium]|jgi:heat-inducible transcriptional repressor|nr:heat-inducible transcription repressor HrcA [Clostridiales bacterium]